MPLIEELPVTGGPNSRQSHGWAYVPDTGFDPSNTDLGPSASRKKRLARDASRQVGADTSAKQAKAIAARLAELEKENYKDAAPVAVPTSVSMKSKGKGNTTNVRRILTSGRNFGHWLAAEEAELAQQQGSSAQQAIPATLHRGASTRVAAPAAKKSTAVAMPPPPTPTTVQTGSISATATAGSSSTPETSFTHPLDPLLVSHVPKPPSQRVMSILLSEAPLSYNAARAGPSKQGIPPRHFCSQCGYWGKVKCRRCGDRTCGRMDCWKGHEEGCQVGW